MFHLKSPLPLCRHAHGCKKKEIVLVGYTISRKSLIVSEHEQMSQLTEESHFPSDPLSTTGSPSHMNPSL